MSDDAPTLSDVFDAAIDAALSGLRVWLPGEVRSYDADSRRAVIQVMVPDGWIAENGSRQTTPMKPLTDVPAALMGSGSLRVKIPIKPGDPCLVLFSSSCITAYKATGRLLDHGDDRHHHEADAFFVPMVRVVGGVEDDAMIEFTDDNLIKAGGDQPLVTRAEFLAHVHPDPTSGFTGTPTVAPGPPTVDPSFPGTSKLRG